MKRATSAARTVMTGLVWGFLSSWNFAFFRPPRCLAWGWREGRLPALRFLGSATCRWAEPCQGRSRRRRGPKASLYKGLLTDDHRLARSRGRGDVRLPLLSSTRVGGPAKRVVHSQPRRLRCRRHETAPYAHRFGWVRSGPGTHATDRRGGGVRRPGPSGRAEDRPRAHFRSGEVWISRRS